ncbi:MAG: hypothetical protein HY258_08390 [Chloroflexi bacterium]|nr:hypothetical protein [Chloroflexota bacterium]
MDLALPNRKQKNLYLRQRKDKVGGRRYSMYTMDAPLYSSGTTVEEALKQGQHTARVFIRNRTACVGCYLAHFCTLEDVANTYGLSLKNLLDELQQAAKIHQSNSIGVKDEKTV